MTPETLNAIKILNAGAGSWCYGRGLGKLYGPSAANLRQEVASALYGKLLPKSSKLCQYGNLRAALLVNTGIEKNCIAVEDDNFNDLIETLK